MSILYVVPTPIGNLGDMTGRALEVLESCDLILAEDTRHTQKLLNHFNIRTKMISYHKFNEKQRSEEIVQRLLNEEIKAALVTDAGTPCISDPGYELVREVREKGIEVIGLAGPSALTTALSISGIETYEFAFYGFLPRKKSELDAALKRVLKNPVKTFVFYESPKRIINLIEKIKEHMPNATLCVCKELTKVHEKTFYGSVNDVLKQLRDHEEVEKGEYVIVGCNNDYKEADVSSYRVGIHGILFDKLIKNDYSLREAVNEVADEGLASKNEAYKASLEIKKFIEKLQGDK
ncbi:MAG TPA: 16S rRNA (cytidine(1402)-2'-O)-methyltransferase [Sedimentibacter sp.]|jgi:16S rRNA (cytidine1402-2'-O)-methyltransferase|nr:16S rRNA (cytidine(1402)-2'-O)-methyltransferase [Sedimentibacter sp.]HOK49010.1 16S rRNA (cytidine(1402)-2'-O)-methyltransferase [Sedimentibacter sp.]HOW22730.1 16S rRNA (cytidine(1402)-2'-O)-methyltransferase [Sedimentibacter sp.]HRC81820.1 16S rRNA (cytidine(1402)-2'-O)-methyltransferase [Sedimentibacter sp.]